MPEYLAPGVYVEERSFRSKSIEGVSTSTTAFVGPTLFGPTEGEPELITNFGQFERIYGGLDPLKYGNEKVDNFLAHGVRAFFDNGGARLYIARAYTRAKEEDSGKAKALIPASPEVIATADAKAGNGTAIILAKLTDAIRKLVKSKAAAMTVMRFVTSQVLVAAVAGTERPPLNFDYKDGHTIRVQLDQFITSRPEPEKGALNGAFTDELKTLLDSAQEAYRAAVDTLGLADTSQASVGGAVAEGKEEGDVFTPLPNDASVGPLSALAPLERAVKDVTTAADKLEELATNLDKVLSEMADASGAALVKDAAQALTSAATGVVTNANAAVAPISGAAREATIGRRVSVEQAQASFIARFPGAAGNMTVTVIGRLGANVLKWEGSEKKAIVSQIREGDLVVIQTDADALIYHAVRPNNAWSFEGAETDAAAMPLSTLDNMADDPPKVHVYPLTLSVLIDMPGKFAQPKLWTDLTVSSLPSRLRDSVTEVFAEKISNRTQEMETPLVLPANQLPNARLAGHLIGRTDWLSKLTAPPSEPDRFISENVVTLAEGNDGQDPNAEAYQGTSDDTSQVKSGLKSLEDIEDISIVAAPGYSRSYDSRPDVVDQINQHLITHCHLMRYRVAILDSPNNQSLSQVQDYRAVMDSTHAALYYPWVRILDPVSERPIDVPPSGFLAGIYARNDNENGVHKAPANEVVRGAIGLETLINKRQQDILNPKGIDCLRFFEGRGFRVWGARTISSDPEWKYLNVRRYFNYLEASIDRSTQWAVFEPNGDLLWANIRRTVEDFLYNEWKEERLAGVKPEQAFFVRCDRSTMTQNDLDNGRLICLIGVSPLYPAEFVIFRIGQWTADRRS